LVSNIRHQMGWMPEGQEWIQFRDQDVVVLGGGDTAMDCVRTAIRQGAASVTCVYRRDETNMPGSRREVANAKEEGVQFIWNAHQKTVVGETEARGVGVISKKRGPQNEKGRQTPKIFPGSEQIIPADAVVLAFGFQPNPAPWFAQYGIETDASG